MLPAVIAPDGLGLAELEGFDSVLVVLLLLTILVFRVRERRHDRLRPGARRALDSLLLGLSFWVAERVLPPLVVDTTVRTAVYLLCNAVVAAALFLAGHSLLGLKERMHGLMRPGAPRPRVPNWEQLLAAPLARGWFLAGIATLTATAVGLMLDGAAAAVVDAPAALASCAGLAVLGLGLWREFTREKLEPVALSCCAAVILYGALQLLRVFPTLAPWVQLVAIVLKVVLLIALLSYWTLIVETARVQREEAALWQPRFDTAAWQADRTAELTHAVGNELHVLQMRCGLLRGYLHTDATSAARTIGDMERQLGALGATLGERARPLVAAAAADTDLRAGLANLLGSIRAQSGIEARLDYDVAGTLRPEVESELLAIARSACSHAGRLARSWLHVSCGGQGDRAFTFRIDCDGSTWGRDANPHLSEIRRRAATLGATLHVAPHRHPHGNELALEVPRWQAS